MKYVGVPLGIWVLFVGSFQDRLQTEFGYERLDVERLTEYYDDRRNEMVLQAEGDE